MNSKVPAASARDAAWTSILRGAVDGRGASIEFANDADRAALIREAAALGVETIEVGRNDISMSRLAFGAILTALGHDPAGVHVVAQGAHPRLVARQRERVIRLLTERATTRPTILLIPPVERLDSTSQLELETFTSLTNHLPLIWAIDRDESIDERTDALPFAASSDSSSDRAVFQIAGSSPIALRVEEVSELVAESLKAVEEVVSRSDHISRTTGGLLVPADDWSDIEAQRLPAPVLRAVRREIFTVLARRGVAPEMLAELVASDHVHGDPLAIRTLSAAARALTASDADAAAEYGLAAVSLYLGPSDELTAFAWELLPVLWQTSRVTEARKLATRVFSEDGRGEVEAQVLWWLARLEGSAERALHYTSSALALPGTSEATQVRLLAVHLRLLSTLGRRDDLEGTLPFAIARARQIDDQDSLSRLLACDSIGAFYRGEYGKSLELAGAAVEAWRASGAPIAEWMPEMIWMPHLELQLISPAQALRHIDRLLMGLSGGSQPYATRFLHAERSLALLTLGQLADAGDEALLAATASEQLWSLAPSASDRLQAIALSVRLKLALHRGDAVELESLRELLESAPAPPGSEARARLDWWRFLLDDVQAMVGASVDPDMIEPVSWLEPADDVLIVRALVANGRSAAALRLSDRAARRATIAEEHILGRTISAHLAGLTSSDSDLLETAVENWSRLGRPLLASLARADAGAVLQHRGDPRGLQLLEIAHAELESRGAYRDAWQVRRQLRAAGHAVGGERDAGTDDGLTPTEHRVVERAVLGLTAPRIAAELSLSPHTVTTHIRHIYAKLGISSRRELIEWASSPQPGISDRRNSSS